MFNHLLQFDAKAKTSDERREWLVIASHVVEKYGEIFKLEYGLPCPTQNITEKGFRHSPDFHSVNYNSDLYNFTSGQAACVKILYECWQNDTPEVGQAYLLEASGAESKKLSDIFKNHQAWGKLIIRGERKGNFRLDI